MDSSIPVTPVAAAVTHSTLSFVDRIMDFFTGLPVPYWLAYLILFILQSALSLIISWIDGWLPTYTFNPLVLLFPFWLWGPLAMMTYLDRTAVHALPTDRESLLAATNQALADLPAFDLLSALLDAILATRIALASGSLSLTTAAPDPLICRTCGYLSFSPAACPG